MGDSEAAAKPAPPDGTQRAGKRGHKVAAVGTVATMLVMVVVLAFSLTLRTLGCVGYTSGSGALSLLCEFRGVGLIFVLVGLCGLGVVAVYLAEHDPKRLLGPQPSLWKRPHHLPGRVRRALGESDTPHRGWSIGAGLAVLSVCLLFYLFVAFSHIAFP